MHLDCHASPGESIGFIPENLQPWPLTLQFKAFATSSTLALEQMTQAERDTLSREFSETEHYEHKAELLCLICDAWRPYKVFFLHWWKKNEPPADSTHVGINTPTTVLRLPRAAAAYGGC